MLALLRSPVHVDFGIYRKLVDEPSMVKPLPPSLKKPVAAVALYAQPREISTSSSGKFSHAGLYTLPTAMR